VATFVSVLTVFACDAYFLNERNQAREAARNCHEELAGLAGELDSRQEGITGCDSRYCGLPLRTLVIETELPLVL
jgi:hypothetical protein